MSLLRSLPGRSGVVGVAVFAATWIALTTAGALPAGTTPARADVGSAVTVTAIQQDRLFLDTAPFPQLTVTVSQTKDLVAQGLKISWTGGTVQSTPPSSQTGGRNFLQIMQCWGDDPYNPGQPDRTTCQYGGNNTAGATRDAPRADGKPEVIALEDQQYTVAQTDNTHQAYTSIPFRSADGTMVANVVNSRRVTAKDGTEPNVNSNAYFTNYTTNEVSWAGFSSTGTGSASFEVQTGLQSRGLGCGNPQTANDGTVSGQSCWLVIIPRGASDNGDTNITSSGLFWDSWKHRLAIKLDFKPLGLRCSVGTAERQLAGSELVAGAVASWQPQLCAQTNGSVFSLITKSEADAVSAANSTDNAPLALTSQPIAAGSGVTDSLTYAPIALTSINVVFAIDRSPSASAGVPADVTAKARLPFTAMKLNPRLLAKLLTNSYLDSIPTLADHAHLGKNPRTILQDPEFLAINDPEWAYQAITSPSVADLMVPQGRSDAATAVWRYILADADARAFLDGAPDKFGMIVNPWASTNADVNSSGAAMALPRPDYPKADPAEVPESGGQGAINVVTWRPYTNDYDTAGYLTLRGDGQVLGPWDPTSQPGKYTKQGRALLGQQHVMALTDGYASSRYQLQVAQLLNPAGQYVSPNDQSLTAAAAAMTTVGNQTQVYEFNPATSTAKGAAGAYPLAVPVYAATSTYNSDRALSAAYAAFIRYASGAGQTPGSTEGELPVGYTPIPAGWRAQAAADAAAIEGTPIDPAPPTPEPTASADSTPSVATGSDSSGSAPSPDVSATPTTVTPTGTPAAPLSSATTPADPSTGQLGAAVPGSVLAGLAAAVAVPLVSRRRPLRSWTRR